MRGVDPGLLNQIPAYEVNGSVSVGGAYDIRKCHGAVLDRGARAIIPPCKNARTLADRQRRSGRKKRSRAGIVVPKPCSVATMERIAPPKPHQDEDALDDPKVYEAKRPGRCLMARDFGRRVGEPQVRIAVLNGHIALGIPVTEPVRGQFAQRQTPAGNPAVKQHRS